MIPAAIEVERLSMRYPKRTGFLEWARHPIRREHVQALDGVTFTVPRGALFGFLGPNGAGKTTLIKILTTLVLPSAGSARVAGLDVGRDSGSVKRRIGVVMSDERSFYWRLTGRQNLQFFAVLQGLSAAAAARRIAELFEVLGMPEKIDARFSDYSSGMKQKLAIARGLLANPEILFFDEPTRSLDPISAAQVRAFVRERLVQGLRKTVFLTTHNLHEAEEISDLVGIINKGRILATGTIAEISARLRSREHYRLRLSGASATLAAEIAALPGVGEARTADSDPERAGTVVELTVADPDRTVPGVVALAVSRGAGVLECARRESTLAEIFSEIITEDTNRGDRA
jgi:ABC-2 type transport system ATP-binding protein